MVGGLRRVYSLNSLLRYCCSSLGVRPWRAMPCFATDILPVCSLTMTAMASVCSVMPIAERCLNPMETGMSKFLLTGSMQRAAFILFSDMMTAPSCSGVFLKKMVSKSCELICEVNASPVCTIASKGLLLQMTINAPVRVWDM